MRKGRQSKGKEIRPTFFVFCEGETEEAYIAFLRSNYRIPIEIVVKKAGSGINKRFIDSYKKDYTTHPKDKTFLIYDFDVPEIVEKLQKISKIELLLSNPCFELWYLLHFKNQTAELTSENCVSELTNHFGNYKKGVLNEKLKDKLLNNKNIVVSRAKNLVEFKNPSTNVYVFVEELDKIKENL
ncbi:abortive infection protein [Bacteroidia bacterium]|nr:abortive infection protein [Bacteroidia bacterium]